MKQLKNNAEFYTNLVLEAVNLYETSKTLELYNQIGKIISEQGEKSFIPHLVLILAENFPNLKGFSARNLRRMRDFYETYKNSADLLELAMNLSWTVNTVILENSESFDEYEFYLKLAISENLSKLKLVAAIEEKLHEQKEAEHIIDFMELCGYFKTAKTTCPPRQVESKIGAFVRYGVLYLQGRSPPVMYGF